MRKAALALSLVAAAMSGWLALHFVGVGSGLEPGYPLFWPFAVPFAVIALGSIAGGIVTLRRPRGGAVLLFAIAVLGVHRFPFFPVQPFWTPFDFAAGIFAVIAAHQSSLVVELNPPPP